ncbi:tripartite tricarboxylate transporter substrate binding protein [Polaromonas sp. P1(28)-8]|nr:tripartite tricarboxylate transporter substrate binding protein [Polaromonas sp. P1(28)-8]
MTKQHQIRAHLLSFAMIAATAFTAPAFLAAGAISTDQFSNTTGQADRFFPTGGFADVAGRRLGEALQQMWKQPVVIDNRPGGAGIIAAQLTADAPPDGYTLFLATDGPFVINPFIYKTLPYDPLKSFEFVSMVAYTPLVLIANTSMVPSKNLSSFVTYAKAQKQSGKSLDYASSGTGGPHHLSMEEFKATSGIDLHQIPYKGGAPALQDVIAGQVPVMFSALAAVLPQIKGGRIRVLGSGGPKRSALAPGHPDDCRTGLSKFCGLVLGRCSCSKGNAEAHSREDAGRYKQGSCRSEIRRKPGTEWRGAISRRSC